MKCIVCDRCKKIIEDPKKYRIVLCSRPLNPRLNGCKSTRSDDKQANDILWEKELCMSCADEIENFADAASSQPESPGGEDPAGPTDPTGPEEPWTDPSGTGDGENTENSEK